MKIGSIINRYIFKELVVPFFLSLLVFTFVFLISRILQLTDLLVNKGVSLLDILKLFIYATPYFFVFTIPMAVLFAVVLTFMKLSADNEITAMKGAGLSLYQILPPAYLVALIGFLMTLAVSVYLLPLANTALRDQVFKMASSKAEVVIRERLFIDDFEGLVLYIEGVNPQTREMSRVMVADERDPGVSQIIMGKRGLLLRDPTTRTMVLRLFDGVIDRRFTDSSRTETITFSVYDLKIGVQQMVASRSDDDRHREELSMGQLWRKMEETRGQSLDYYLYFMVFHERLSIPFACLCLGLLGVPLGIQSRSKKTSSSLLLAVTGFLCYYLLYSAAKGLGETGLYPPVLGLWLPNILFAGLTVYLMIRTANERPWALFELASTLRQRFSFLRRREAF